MVQQPQLSRTALFWAITQRAVEPIICPETFVTNYHYTLRNRPEEHSSHLRRGESLKPQLSAAESLWVPEGSLLWQAITVPNSTKKKLLFDVSARVHRWKVVALSRINSAACKSFPHMWSFWCWPRLIFFRSGERCDRTQTHNWSRYISRLAVI
jgi:hypothetical protein